MINSYEWKAYFFTLNSAISNFVAIRLEMDDLLPLNGRVMISTFDLCLVHIIWVVTPEPFLVQESAGFGFPPQCIVLKILLGNLAAAISRVF